jgi:hypothetical protein
MELYDGQVVESPPRWTVMASGKMFHFDTKAEALAFRDGYRLQRSELRSVKECYEREAAMSAPVSHQMGCC